jgi:hypothetical protein
MQYKESQERGDYLAAAVWGAVLLESFLGELIKALPGCKGGQDDLNGRIDRLRQYSRNRPADGPELPDQVVKRCDEIRSIRNRLVHDTGLPNATMEGDARQTEAHLSCIIDWAVENVRTLRPQDPSGADVGGTSGMPPPSVRVFLSCNTPHTVRQAFFRTGLCGELRRIGVDSVAVEYGEFDKKDPLGKVLKTVQTCQGMVVVGLERTHAYLFRDKEGAGKEKGEKEDYHRRYPSGWIHMEAGMAHALGLQVFVICEANIHSDGIFDREWNSYAVVQLPSLDTGSAEFRRFLRRIEEWTADVRAQRASEEASKGRSGRVVPSLGTEK